jgi:hypothetical protein
MRVVRYLLQAAILLFGGSALVGLALSPRFELFMFLGLAAFFCFLFFLTLLLREHTESSIVFSRDVNPEFFAACLFIVGLSIVWLSASILNGYTGATTRRAALLRVAIEVLGPWPPAAFFLVTGLFVLRGAYVLFRQR